MVGDCLFHHLSWVRQEGPRRYKESWTMEDDASARLGMMRRRPTVPVQPQYFMMHALSRLEEDPSTQIPSDSWKLLCASWQPWHEENSHGWLGKYST